MKKLILSFSVIALLASCGSEGEQEEQNEDQTNEETVEEETVEAPKDLIFTSYDLLTQANDGQEEFISTLRGNNITITDIVYQAGDAGYMNTWGYNGTDLSLYSDADKYPIFIGDEKLPAYGGLDLGIQFSNSVEDVPVEFIAIESVNENDNLITIFHTILSVKVSGDNIELTEGQAGLSIEGANITSSDNF